MSGMELDKKLKIEALFVVHLVNSKQEIDDLILEANRTVFVSGHRQVTLMARRVKKIADETTNKWDIFFVEREKKEEKDRQKMDKSFTKVYQKDKGKGKIGSVPNITIKDNLPPSTQDAPPVTVEAPTQTDNQPEEKVEEMTRDDINPESAILFTMNVDTQDFNIVMDKETTEVKKPKTIPNYTQLNTKILGEAQVEAVVEKGQEQSVAEPTVSKEDSKDERKVEKQSEHKKETANKDEVKDGNKIEEVVKESGDEKKPTTEPHSA